MDACQQTLSIAMNLSLFEGCFWHQSLLQSLLVKMFIGSMLISMASEHTVYLLVKLACLVGYFGLVIKGSELDSNSAECYEGMLGLQV